MCKKFVFPVSLILLGAMVGNAWSYEKASNPSPSDGATCVDPDTYLSWSPGEYAYKHDVYFGVNFNDVFNATPFSPLGVYKGRQDPNSYNPGGLQPCKTYYWRIDEVNGINIWKGDVWSFTTAGSSGKCKCDSPYLLADLDKNCYVDFYDFARFALYWLETCDVPGECGWADMYPPGGDGIVGLRDFAEFVAQWFECTDPANPDCEPLPPYAAESDLYEPPNALASPANPTYGVNLATGESRETVVDLRIPGRGLDFIWLRTYRSRTGSNTSAGNNCDYSYNINIEPAGWDFIVHNGSGRRDLYKHQADGTWTADGLFRVLARNPDLSFTLTFPDKTTWIFNRFDGGPSEGKIKQIKDRNGNSLSFAYDGGGKLVTVQDTLDRDVTISYNGNGFVSSITDFAGRTVSYQYYDGIEAGGSFGDLKSVTTTAVTGTPTGNDFPDGKTTTYTYSRGSADERLNHNLLTITDPNGQTFLQNVYSPTTDSNDPLFDHVVRQIWGGPDDIIDITYVPQAPDASNNYAVVKAVTNDRVGNVAAHFFDDDNRLVMVRQYTGRANPNLPTYLDPNTNPPVNKLRPDDPAYFETQYEYNGDSLPIRIDYPNGNYIVNVYGADLDPCAPARSRGNLRERHRYAGVLAPVSDQNEISEYFEYDTDFGGGCCGFNFVTCSFDPNGNVTQLYYDTNGNRIRTTRVRGAGEPNIIDEWEYNAYGQTTARVLPDNGSGNHRRDGFTYYSNPADANYGRLREAIVDACNLALTTTYEYDQAGNVRRIIDANGSDTQYIYNQLNQVVRETGAEVTDGSGVRYQKDTYYDKNNNVVRVDVQNKDDQGNIGTNAFFTTTYEFEYDKLIRTTTEVNETDSIVTEFEYDKNRNRTLTRFGEATNGNQAANTVRTLRDERNLVYRITRAEGDPNQSTTQYDYDGNGNRTKVHEGLEGTPSATTFEYDGFNRLIATADPMGNVTTNEYDIRGSRIRTGREGDFGSQEGDNVRLYEANYEYDALNRLVKTEVDFFDPNTQADVNDGKVTTQYQYNDNSQVIKVIDDRGNQTLTTYDTANRKSVVIDAKGNKTTYSYDKNSNVIAVTKVEKSDLGDPNETFVTTYEYDNLNRRIKTVDNAGNATDFAYDSRGNRTKVVDAKGAVTRYEYDGLNRLITTIRDPGDNGSGPADPNLASDPNPADGATCVDPNTYLSWSPGLYAAKHDVYLGTNFDDVNDAITLDPVYKGRQDPNNYNPGGLAADTIYYWRIDEVNGPSTWKGRVWSFSTGSTPYKHLDIVTTQTWDDNSRLTTQSDDKGNKSTYEYDPLNRRIKTTYADGTSKTARYDVHNNPIQTIDAAGSVVDYTYDLLNRLTRKDVTPGAGVSGDTTFENYEYDGLSRLVYAEDNDSVVKYSYDSVSNVTGETLNGKTTTSSYDGLGNKLSCTYPGGRNINYTYDALNRIKTITDANGSIARYDYIGPRRVKRRDYGNNTRTTYTYDNIRRITQTRHARSLGPPVVLDARTYTWDATNNKTQRKDVRAGGPLLTHDYTYDAVDRLVHTTVTNNVPAVVRSTDYSLDGVGNRTNVMGLPDPGVYAMNNTTPEPADEQMNQYTATSFDGRGYDKNGNLNTINNGLPTQKGLTYNYRNQMVKVTDSNTGKIHTYSYDPLGRRIQKVIDSNGTPQTTRYFYAGFRVIEEQDGSGATQATYVYGNYIDEVLNMQRGANKYYYHSDDLFNVMAVTDTNRNVVERYEYEDYGRPVNPTTLVPIIGSPSAIGNPYYFTGRNYDAETGLYYYRTRYLDPRAGRFTTRDTIGIWGDRSNLGNAYTYVSSRPYSLLDPTGRDGGGPYNQSVSNLGDAGYAPSGGVYPTELEGASYGEPSEIEWDFDDNPKGVYPTDFTGASRTVVYIEWDEGEKGVYPTDFTGASRTGIYDVVLTADEVQGLAQEGRSGLPAGSYSLWDISGGSYSVADSYAPGGTSRTARCLAPGVFPTQFDGSGRTARCLAPGVFPTQFDGSTRTARLDYYGGVINTHTFGLTEWDIGIPPDNVID